VDEGLAALVAGVELLSLDAGNTVIFLDHARLAKLASGVVAVDAAALIRAEGEAKRATEDDTMTEVAWGHEEAPGARAWGRMVATILARAGCPTERLPWLLDEIWRDHVRWNLWSVVPTGLKEGLAAVREKGVRVAIVSNSEGMLEELFDALGILRSFDTVVDSAKVGFAKPDPRIFEEAMRRCRATPGATLHLGDIYAGDVLGARAAGVRAALVDPFGHFEGRHLDVPRVPGAVEVARAICDSIAA
jgi:FMN phosphatase YigB (HAD superfamily)